MAILFVLAVLLAGCGTGKVQIVEPEPALEVYDPCHPPCGNCGKVKANDPFFRGHAYNARPTACI